MVRFDFKIRNPFTYKSFESVLSRAYSVSKYRTLELQVFRYSYNLLELVIDFNWKGQDHAGPSFEIGVLGWYFTASLPHNYHWDYEKNDWEWHDFD